MKNRFVLVFMFLAANNVFSQFTFSGIFDSTFSMRVGGDEDFTSQAGDFSCGIEEFANVRFQARLRENGVFYGAVNLFAAAGDYAHAAQAAGFTGGENYVAGIELERLYFRLNGEHFDFSGGLMRFPFGYSQVWGPCDFLNPKNPLKPDARPRAVLGAGLSMYPADDIKILMFTSSPQDPFSQGSDGWLLGACSDILWNKNNLSLQALYSYEMPTDFSQQGVHRAGLSVKFDFEVSFIMDALYTYNHDAGTEIDGLSVSAGADYSFVDGKLIMLAEYLYNGETSSTALGYGGSFSNRNYLYTSLTWLFNDFTNISAALISSLDDVSFTPVIAFNHDLFQGATLTITAQAPFDRDGGEFGPRHSNFNLSTRLRLRF